MVLIGNIPLFIIGWRFMGGTKFAIRTIFSVIVFSIAVDLSVQFLPPEGVTDDILLKRWGLSKEEWKFIDSKIS